MLKIVKLKFMILLCLVSSLIFSQASSRALVLQEMSWVEIKDYLKQNDMVIIPLGSTEQHGPHLPLGTDYYEALEISKIISEQTGVVVAPVLHVGYSQYHSGFPGTLSLKPETMEQVLFETTQMLIKYKFKKFLFFNYHGGNNIVQQKIIHRINHSTPAIAISIGVGSSFKDDSSEEFFDWHAGTSETSIMLYLKPNLVHLEKASKPILTFTPKMKKLRNLSKVNPHLAEVWASLFGVPMKTNKGGASHQLSSNGIWSFSNPRKTASRELGKKSVNKWVKEAVQFINDWKQSK